MVIDSVGDMLLLILGAFGGSSAVVVGLSGWLGKLWAERLMARETEALRSEYAQALEQVRSRLEHVGFVSKTHYETEFAGLKAIWAAVSDARAAVGGLRPMGDFKPADESDDERDERYGQRHDRLHEAVSRLRQTVLHMEPFVPVALFTAAMDCVSTAESEYIDFSLDQPYEKYSTGWFAAGRSNWLKSKADAEKVAGLIRQRLEEMSTLNVVDD